jgi:hypothetical protein
MSDTCAGGLKQPIPPAAKTRDHMKPRVKLVFFYVDRCHNAPYIFAIAREILTL